MEQRNANRLLSLISVITLSSVFNSCSLILSTALGIKAPREESYENQRSYLQKNNLSIDHLYNFDGMYKDSLKHSSYYFMEGDTSFSPIQFRMYNSKGEFISGWAICIGNAEKMNLYEEFPPRRLSW